MSLVRVFNEFQRIWGICPCCGDVFRLSDAKVYSTKRPPVTDFDRIDHERAKLDAAEQLFAEQLGAMRTEAARKGRREADKKLREISSYFAAHSLHPHDVYALFDPVRFVVFDGLSQGEVHRVAFVDDAVPEREHVHASIEKALAAGNIEWIMLRIDEDGRVVRE